jgi:transposase
VELCRKVRLACSEGMSARSAAKHFGISRDTVKKMVSFSVPPGYSRTAVVKRPKLDGFTPILDQWLVEDQGRSRKPRHTAKRVFERLRDEHGFTGGYTIIKDYMREQERRGREMFVPLAHAPGHAQADFGEAMVVIGGVEQKAHFFALDLPHSDACFIRAYQAATAEAWVPSRQIAPQSPAGQRMAMCMPLRSLAACRPRSSMTTINVWWRALKRMGPGSGPSCSAASSRIT